MNTLMRTTILLCSLVALAACSTTDSVRGAPTSSAPAAAATPATGTDGRINDIQSFLEAQRELREEVENGKYGRFSDNEMDLLVTSQNTLFRILEGRQSIDELDRDQRIAVYNAQEAVAAVLTGTVESRPICRRQHTVGTNRLVVACFTPQQRREMSRLAQETRDWFDNMYQRGAFWPPSDG